MKVNRSKAALFLYRLSVFFGIVAAIAGIVFLFSPKNGIAVAMAFSLFGLIGAAFLCLLFGIAGFIVKIGTSSDE